MYKGKAYSIFEQKNISEDEENFYVQGIASTPTPDRSKDEVMPEGAKFSIPMPFLWQHQSDKPIGRIEFAKPNKNGIPFKAAIPKIKEAGVLKDRIDEAIQSIRYKLVTGVSIGFNADLDDVEFKDDGGIIFRIWNWLELSLVTIPNNPEAELLLNAVKSYDRKCVAAIGKNTPSESIRPLPGDSGKKSYVKLIKPGKIL